MASTTTKKAKRKADLVYPIKEGKVLEEIRSGLIGFAQRVAIEMALQRLLAGGQLNLLEICKRLRDQRMHSVQVEIQYIYVAESLCEYGRAMKYIVDPQLLKEFEKFKESFNAFVAGLGGEEPPGASKKKHKPARAPVPLPVAVTPPDAVPPPIPIPAPPPPPPPPPLPFPQTPQPWGGGIVPCVTQYTPEQDLPP